MTEKHQAADTDPHPDYPGLTHGDVKKAKASALAKAEKARRDAAMKRVEAEEVDRLKQEEGIDTNEEMVEIVLDLAPDMPWLSTNGVRYEHGRKYRVRRSVAQDLLARQFAGHQNESRRLGQDANAFYQKEKAPVINHVGGRVVGVA